MSDRKWCEVATLSLNYGMTEIMLDIFLEQIIDKAHSRRALHEGRYLFHQDDPVKSVFVIESGLIELTRHQRDGSVVVLQRATEHTVLAEASVYSSAYHCDAIVAKRCLVHEISKSSFLEYLRVDEDFSTLWAGHLAKEVQSARYRSEILARRTVAERLDAWLAWKGQLPPSKGQWKSIAVQIGVSPEALYRELAKRRSDH
jgi:CRP-like cAMP-binding protein